MIPRHPSIKDATGACPLSIIRTHSCTERAAQTAVQSEQPEQMVSVRIEIEMIIETPCRRFTLAAGLEIQRSV
jgi:hypothetical protein